MKTLHNPTVNEFKETIKKTESSNDEIQSIVSDVFKQVKEGGDKALKHFTQKFDKVELNELTVSKEEIDDAEKEVSKDLKVALGIAYDNIKKFHEAQKENPQVVETTSGVKCWRKSVGIEKVGIYIPGGTAPLFSTVLMLAIPAQISGCKEIVLVTPPNKEGKVNPIILYCAKMCGVTKIHKVGGTQAIAALTYGTESITSVYKIFGPGNRFVTAAKQYSQSFGLAIDMPAGPSEVLIVADDTANPAFVAADMLSQAEHGFDSQSVLISTSSSIIEKTITEIQKQLNLLNRKDFIMKSLENSLIVKVKDLDEALYLSNIYAPEHLILSCKYEKVIEKIVNAGSVFLGNYSPESAGDYASGTNHTLPTSGWAKAYSGVSLDSFVRKITFQELTKEGIQNIGKTVEIMAENEGLDAHKNAVTLRMS